VRLRRIGFVFQEYYALILNRLRLEAKGDLAPGLALDLQYDNELLLGSYLGTAEFRSAKDSAAPQYWWADANDLERGDLYGRHRPYRAKHGLRRRFGGVVLIQVHGSCCCRLPKYHEASSSSALEVKGIIVLELSIGEVARRTGVSPSTPRYYEQQGLLPAVPRIGGRRRYSEREILSVEALRFAQSAGLTLGEIKRLRRRPGEHVALGDR